MKGLVFVKLRYKHRTKKAYATLIDGDYYVVIIDYKKFNEKRYSPNGKFCLFAGDYLDYDFVCSSIMRRVVYDDESKDILKSSNSIVKIDITDEMFEDMLKDGSIALDMIGKSYISVDDRWRFQESIILKVIPNKYYISAEYKDEKGDNCSSKIHYHHQDKIEIYDRGRNIVIHFDGAQVKNMTVDGNIKEEVEVLASTIVSNINFLI